jgi:hypothetical protein
MSDGSDGSAQENTSRLVEAGKATRFKPGVSGNPGGRPKSKYLTDVVDELLVEKLDSPAGRKQFKDALWKRLLSVTVSGSMTLDKIWARIEGPIRDELEVTVKDDLAEVIRKARERAAAKIPELELSPALLPGDGDSES